MKNQTIDDREIAHFAKDSSHWWDPKGPFRPLHWITPARMEYLRTQILPLFPIKGASVLDIGCGGGLACEGMARLGANVTGIDADANAIRVAQDHAAPQNLKITYINGAAEDLVARRKTYDVVLALEVIEHVSDAEAFVSLCSKLVCPGGVAIFSTLNRTWKSYALGIVAAEHILKWAPQGTHEWNKFIKPSELARMARHNNLTVTDVTGLVYNPLKHEFSLDARDVDVNYFMTATR
jgi:2-polyprenyl-6-hydroxyphenyl methylase/3-demethylubiquinone-9 3-methyltransferase